MILMREITARAQPRRRRFHRAQHAVDAIAHAELVLHRLDVNVRGARFHRLGDQQIDEADDGRFAGYIFQPIHVVGALSSTCSCDCSEI